MGPHVKVLYGYLRQYLSVRLAVVQYSGFPSPSSFPPPLLSALLFPLSYYLSSEPFIHVQLLAFCFVFPMRRRRSSGATEPLMARFINCINLSELQRWKKHTLSTLENLRGWQGHDSLSYGPPSHCAVEMWLPVPALTYFLISVSSKEILILEEPKSGNI